MKNQSRAGGQQQVLQGAQTWATGSGNSRHRWTCVSGCAIAFQDFSIRTFSWTSFQVSVKQQFGPHSLYFSYLYRTGAFGSL